MEFSRRGWLLMSCAAACSLFLRVTAFAQTAGTRGRRRPDGSEDAANGSSSGNFGMNGTKAALEDRQKNIKKDVEKLYGLATELKTEVEKTDSTTVLSLAMLKKADEIEKLAKQIKERARG
jgi:adenylosuccinate lyase